MDEGSIGGTVNIATRKPLDMPEQISITGRISYARNDRVEKTDPSASAAFGWKNADDTFGLILSAQSSNESIRRDGIESYGTVLAKHYRDGLDGAAGSIATGNCKGACADALNANPNAVGPSSMSAHFFEQKRKRNTYSASLQFKPMEQLNIEATALKIDANFDHMAQSMFAWQGNTYGSLGSLTDITIKDGLITGATHKGGRMVFDLQNRRAKVESETYDIKVDWTDERWFASGQLGHTKAQGGPKQVYGSFLAPADYSWSIANGPGTPGTLNISGRNPFTDPELFRMDGGYGANPNSQATWNTGWGGNLVDKPTLDKETYGQVDFGLKLDSPVYQLRFGYKHRAHETGQIQRGVVLASVQGWGDATTDMFNPRDLPSNYLDGFSGFGDLANRFTIDGWALADYIASNDWLAPWQNPPVPTTQGNSEFVRNTWTIEEDIKAAYLQADFSFERLRGNIGLRYVRTDLDSSAYACNTGRPSCTTATMTQAQAEASYDYVTRSSKYSNVLPNLNLVYDASDELVLRFSAAKTMARPNYADVSSYLFLSDQALTGGGGNPNLRPYRSTNLDFSGEWYFSQDAILAASIFYRDVSDYVLRIAKEETHYNVNQLRDAQFLVDRPQNAGDAKIKGYSLAWQQNLGAGFGIIANYTYSDGEATNGRPLPFNSKNQYNLSPFFENDKWNARITYNWRDKYFTRVSGGRDVWTMEYRSLDASVAYKVTENLSIGLEGMNLLDEKYHSYFGTEKLLNGAYKSGRRYMASLRFAF